MSNNVVSQQFPIPGMPIGDLETIVNSSLPAVHGGVMASGLGDPSFPQYPMSSGRAGVMEQISGNPASHSALISQMNAGELEIRDANFGSRQFLMPNSQVGSMGNMLNNVGSEQFLIPAKRKVTLEPQPHNPSSSQSSMPNKRFADMEHRPWLQQAFGLSRSAGQMQPSSPTAMPQLSPATNKKSAQTVPAISRSVSQRSSTPKNQIPQANPSPRGQKEAFDSVRSKMRESLAAALALVSQQDKSLNGSESSPNEAGTSVGQKEKNSQPAGSGCFASDSTGNVSEGSSKTFEVKGELRSSSENENVPPKHLACSGPCVTQTLRCYGPDFRSSNVLPHEDIFGDNFFAKDEFLQGNGLSWVLDSDMEVIERNELQPPEKQNLAPTVVKEEKLEKLVQTPETLASKIEAELFKLFGGVNKKYKEKGRSLLFNLKDRNNPELRERVMSGEILPERLCSMTAEELASKELSEWRMAKAEELAQMVVLPDSEVDIRRLVRKTHKGEFQVEVEHDDTVPVEISARTNTYTESQPNNEDMERNSLKPDSNKDEMNTAARKDDLEDKITSYKLTIPSNEGTDVMQGLMVDDGFKDAEFLPPIVSLDEFMKSLDSEPPFENLSVSGKLTTMPVKDDSEAETAAVTPAGQGNDIPGQKGKDEEADRMLNAVADSHTKVRSRVNHAGAKLNNRNANTLSGDNSTDVGSSENPTKSAVTTSKDDYIWEGSLQLNVSATISVGGIFISGEKTQTGEWPGFLEIKGRVRLDAFEKFLQELPLSRSRALMVLHFNLKDNCPEDARETLLEVADSYVSDERVGFAEPASGVELYLCPLHKRTLEMIGKILPKDHADSLNAIEIGLVGVVVWRKPQLTSAISPNSSSHHKHTSKKHLSSRRHHDSKSNVNASAPQETQAQMGLLPPGNPQPQSDDDEDVPPGFGPAASREEDDLPEFNFSGGTKPSLNQISSQSSFVRPGLAPFNSRPQTLSRQAEQMRELVLKYGQPNSNVSSVTMQDRGVGVPMQPWNDDDDDIPEWQPNTPQPLTMPGQSSQQPALRPHHLVNQQPLRAAPQLLAHQQMVPSQSLQAPLVVTQGYQNSSPAWQQGSWAAVPTQGGQFYLPTGRGVSAGQPAGAAWRRDVPKSRGF